jgi:hydroxymethylpyrimidine/phosphomethylpyrimidine kinase
MLHSAEIIVGVAAELNRFHISNTILDPVMVATSGDRLIRDDAVDSLKKELFSMVRLITPNVPEAEILFGTRITGSEDMMAAARDLGRQYAVSVLVKGGHLADRVIVDVLWDNERGDIRCFENPRIATNNSHGTGCTLSSAIAAFAAKGMSVADAVASAEQYLHAAIRAGARFVLGKGNGPVHHFHRFW